MKEFLQTIIATILSAWSSLAAATAATERLRAELWTFICALPLLLVCLIKNRKSHPKRVEGDEPWIVETAPIPDEAAPAGIVGTSRAPEIGDIAPILSVENLTISAVIATAPAAEGGELPEDETPPASVCRNPEPESGNRRETNDVNSPVGRVRDVSHSEPKSTPEAEGAELPEDETPPSSVCLNPVPESGNRREINDVNSPVGHVSDVSHSEPKSPAVYFPPAALADVAPISSAETLANSAAIAATPVAENLILPESATPAHSVHSEPALESADANRIPNDGPPASPAPGPLPNDSTPARPPAILDTTFSERIVRDAMLSQSSGVINITLTARALHIERNPLWDFISARPQLLQLIDESREAMTLWAEDLLRHEINAGKPWAVKFTLATQGWDKYGACNGPTKQSSQTATRNRGPNAAEDPSEPSPLAPQIEHCLRSLWTESQKFRCAAEKLGVSSAELLSYVTLRPELRARFGDRREELLDDAETRLYRQLELVRPWGIRLTLETLGSSLGYTKGPLGGASVPKRSGKEPSAPHRPSVSELQELRTTLIGPQREASALQTEAKLRAALNGDSRWAIEFVLLKLGQDRGYVKGPPRRRRKAPTPVGQVDLTRLTPEERAELEMLLAKKRGQSPNSDVSSASQGQPRNVAQEQPAPAETPKVPHAPREVFISRSEMSTDSRSEMSTDSRSEMSTDSRSEMSTDSRSEMGTDSRSEMGTELRSEMGTDSRSEMSTGSRSEMGTGSRSEMSTGSRSEMGTGSRSEMGTGSRSEMSTDSRSEMSTDSLMSELLAALNRTEQDGPLPVVIAHSWVRDLNLEEVDWARFSDREIREIGSFYMRGYWNEGCEHLSLALQKQAAEQKARWLAKTAK